MIRKSIDIYRATHTFLFGSLVIITSQVIVFGKAARIGFLLVTEPRMTYRTSGEALV